MASIRRTLSPMPRAGAMHNGELYSVCSSPLSKSSSCNQDYPPLGGSLSSLSGSMDSYSVLYRLQAALLGIITRRFRTLERSKSKGQLWRRALFHFFICFLVGIFIGLTPLISTNISINLGSKHQAFSFEVLSPDGNAHQYDGTSKKGSLAEAQRSQDNASLETWSVKQEQLLGISNDNPVTQLPFQDSDLMDRKLLIIVTPTYTRLFQAYYLNRLAQTLRLVSSPLLWIVVEMFSQSAETADILRRTGVMYRHLACYKNLTSVRDRRVHQRNVALSHIETHRLYGIVYFADDDNMYSVNLFEQMREIRCPSLVWSGLLHLLHPFHLSYPSLMCPISVTQLLYRFISARRRLDSQVEKPMLQMIHFLHRLLSLVKLLLLRLMTYQLLKGKVHVLALKNLWLCILLITLFPCLIFPLPSMVLPCHFLLTSFPTPIMMP
ncbi:probable beta-1,4-xylosyltransferase IRX9H isoform X1 [Macadamia integrifolia]|uniref:probable beta-1,4-xylosyltransferase IRX9H isoform X2 n=1 Tax=Macadamia integrifolia TaxID=60698 RepID=UPI001C4FA865|nr:probable beta-1,4-xylosyltransferase IRX9H isoform X2 [Macadamia integrifolia]XP_042487537.1 probable beta-1,4-xylosyltransferase IRX9H isoform X1 [Macadamia integrifolia]XP_042487538.1 probable beta-1,4-xylosyltransferase IRX9H isoform X1 [Macadamia integrifolia]